MALQERTRDLAKPTRESQERKHKLKRLICVSLENSRKGPAGGPCHARRIGYVGVWRSQAEAEAKAKLC